MKKRVMARICRILDTMGEIHTMISGALEGGQAPEAMALLETCQEAAAAIGAHIDKGEGESVGEGTIPAALLREYQEALHLLHETISKGAHAQAADICERLNKSYLHVSDRIRYGIKVKKEIVFLPYKASMWDSLESVWRAADADPDSDAYVIPIPYYGRGPDGSLRELHYEGGEFPADVPIVHYDRYSFEENHPDMVFIHNPYDGDNYVTTVHPFFYSKNLKKYTDKLVYIPYFVLADTADPHDPSAIEEMASFARASAVMNADVVVVQSENMRMCYIEAMVKLTGEKTRKHWDKKILGLGSPKFDKVSATALKHVDIPNEWKNVLVKTDGSLKKVVLYNTSLTAFLRESDRMLDKIGRVLTAFEAVRDEVALLWRPHPLMEATINSMRPRLCEKYQGLVDGYRQSGWGIYDGTAELNRAIAMADVYYGDDSSLVQLCQKAGIPTVIQNILT